MQADYHTESRRDQEEGGELDSHEEVIPEEFKTRKVVLGLRVGLLLLQLFSNGEATDIVFVTLFCIAAGTAIAWCGGPLQPWSSALAAVSRFHSSVPLFPLVPVPNRPTRLRGR